MTQAATTGARDRLDAFPSSLVLAGAGKMGGAMLEAWLSLGLARLSVAVVDPRPSAEMAETLRRHAVALNPDPANRPPPDVLVLAVKPQMLGEAAPALAPFAGPDTLLISVVAGKNH